MARFVVMLTDGTQELVESVLYSAPADDGFIRFTDSEGDVALLVNAGMVVSIRKDA